MGEADDDRPDDGEAEAEATVADEAEAALDAALGKLLPADEDDEKDLHVARASKKAAAPKGDEDEDAPEAEEGEEGELEEAASAEDDDGDDEESDEDADAADADDKEDEEDELDAAYATLLSLPKAHRPLMSDLKNMPRAKLIAWAKRVDEASEATEPASSAAQQGRDAPEGAKGAGKDTPTAEDAGKAWATMRASIAEKLGVDEDSADGLKPMHDTIESLRAELRELRSDMEKSSTASREREGRETIDREVRRLERNGHPGLAKDEDKVQRLTQAAAALIKGGVAATAREAFTKAAKAELPKPKRTDLAQLRRNGTSAAPERRGGYAPGAELTEQSFWDRSVDLAYAGKRDAIARMKFPSSKSSKPSRRLHPRDD